MVDKIVWVHTDKLKRSTNRPHKAEPYARKGDETRCSVCGDILVRKED